MITALYEIHNIFMTFTIAFSNAHDGLKKLLTNQANILIKLKICVSAS